MPRLLLPVFLVLLLPLSVQAQSVWTPPSTEDHITVEGYKPVFAAGSEITFLTSSWFVSGRYSLSKRLGLVAELGMSHFGQNVGTPDGAIIDEVRETAFGNTLLGAHYVAPIDGLQTTLGVRLPTATDNFGGVTGVYADPYRYEAFIRDFTSVLLDVEYVLPFNEELSFRFAGRPSVHFDHFDSPSGNRGGTDVAVRYTIQGWYETPQLRGSVGFVGSSSLITGLHMGDQNTTAVTIGTAIYARIGTVEPGVTLQVPMTAEYSDQVDAVLGVVLAVPLR